MRTPHIRILMLFCLCVLTIVFAMSVDKHRKSDSN